ncbi:MAG TPA: ABC transporter substrate-binding protein [Thermodesulfobacteriota bacterium]|nr:ABC transporter substrate-binding protein [Thermodesulfobacteriota bacterium]
MMKRNRAIFVFFFCLITALSCPTLCPSIFPQGKDIPAKGGIYRRPLEFGPKTLDPAVAVDIYSVTVLQQIFDGLVQFDKDLNIIPCLAKSWKISPDGLTYTFYLRQGVKFHHGRELTAKDVAYSLTRILDAKVKSPAATFLDRVIGSREFKDGTAQSVRGFIVPDRYTFIIKLSEPYTPFILILGMNKFKVLPQEEVEKSEIQFGRAPVGTGPFKYVSSKEGEQIILDANPDYFEGRPCLDRIIFKIFHGSPREEILRLFKSGELEDSPIPFNEVEEMSRSAQYMFFQKPVLSLRFYGLNSQFSALKTKQIRKAINLSVPKDEIGREILKGKAHLTDRIIPLGMPGYQPIRATSGYQPSRAGELLKEAGYPEGKGFPSIDFWSAARSELAVRELDLVKSSLSKNGITLNIHYETQWPRFQEILTTKKAPMFMYAWYADFPDPDNFLGTLFHSKSSYNYTAYFNPEVDRLLDRAKAERDYLKRMELYRKIEETVLDDAPIVPMVNHLLQWIFQPYVNGIELNALGGAYIQMKKIWLSKGN